jgi:drug/metabolite transporter, DME family
MRKETSSYGRGLFFVGFAAVCWGIGGAVAAVLYRTSGLGPMAVSFWRLACGIGLLLVVAIVSGERHRIKWRDALVLGAGLAVYQTAYYGSIAYAGLAIGTVVTLGSGPVLISLAAWRVLGERISWRAGCAITVAVAGLLLLAGDGDKGGGRLTLGLGCGLLSAAGYAVVTIYSRWTGGALAGGTTSAFAVAAVCVLPLAGWEGLLPSTGRTPETLGWLIFLGAVPTALAYRMFFAGVTLIPATAAAVITLLEPVAGVLLAVGLLGEHIGPVALTGAALMIAAVALLSTDRPAATAPITAPA